MQNRNYGLDIFRIMCCLGVLDYHIVGAYLNSANICSGGGARALFSGCILCSWIFSLIGLSAWTKKRIGY